MEKRRTRLKQLIIRKLKYKLIDSKSILRYFIIIILTIIILVFCILCSNLYSIMHFSYIPSAIALFKSQSIHLHHNWDYGRLLYEREDWSKQILSLTEFQNKLNLTNDKKLFKIYIYPLESNLDKDIIQYNKLHPPLDQLPAFEKYKILL